MRLQGYTVLLALTVFDVGMIGTAEIVSTTFDKHLETQLATSNVLNILESVPKVQKIGNGSLFCRVYRLLKNVVSNLKNIKKPISIVSGLEIVPIKDTNLSAHSKESYRNDSEVSLLDNFSEYLKTHELNIKFSDLLKDTRNITTVEDMNSHPHDIKIEGRKKDKGQGLLLAMSVMFAKIMALLGIGGISLLALKALGVASFALILAGLMGIKSLAQHATEATTHSVQYVATDGHLHKRRRRSNSFDKIKNPLPLVYRSWDEY